MTRQTALLACAFGTQLLFTLACYGGASLNGNDAGSDGWLDHTPAPNIESNDLQGDGRCDWLGRPFVSRSVENAFALLYTDLDSDCGGANVAHRKMVFAIHPDAPPEALIDVSGQEDVRLLDTAAGLLLMGEAEDATGFDESLWLLDHETLEVLAESSSDLRLWGTRTSPTRQWVMAADNDDNLQLSILDPRDLSVTSLDDGAVWVEGQWMPHSDRLATIHFDTMDHARLEVRDFSDGLPDAPVFQAEITGYSFNWAFELTWVGISDDERYIAYPVTEAASSTAVVLVLDLQTGEITPIEGISGPVRFTPDNTLIGWSTVGEGSQVILADSLTQETTEVDLSFHIPEFVMSPSGSSLLIADAMNEEQMIVYDIDHDTTIVLPFAASLQAYTTRHNAVWMVEDGNLLEIQLETADTRTLDLPNPLRHVVWMPESDLLYADEVHAPTALFLDPVTGDVMASHQVTIGSAPALDLSVARLREERPHFEPVTTTLEQ